MSPVEWARLGIVGGVLLSVVVGWLIHRHVRTGTLGRRPLLDPEELARRYFAESPRREAVASQYMRWLSYRPEVGDSAGKLRPDDDLIPLGFLDARPELYAEDLAAAFNILINPAELIVCHTPRQFVDFLEKGLNVASA